MSGYVRYIDKTQAYYLSQGYDKPYQWAHFDDIPFSRLSKPLSECRATIISTSDVAIKTSEDAGEEKGEGLLVGNAYDIPSDTPEELLYTHQEHYDRYATHLDDVNSYFPITRLHEKVEQGRLGSVAARLYGVYTAYSQKKTIEIDAPELLKRCREDEVDLAIFTPV